MKHNLNLLPALSALLQTKNITRAAQRLNVSQSAMSKTLSQIRQAFGDEILVREGSAYVLTQRGHELADALPDLLKQMDAIFVPGRAEPALSHRCFRLASSDYVAQFILPELALGLKEHAPHASVEYKMWQKDWLVELAEKSLDLVSTIVDQVPENLYGKYMGEDELVIMMHESHPLANQDITLEQYLECEHIQITGGGDKDSPVDSVLYKMDAQRRFFASVPFFQSGIEILSRTQCLLTTPLHIAYRFTLEKPFVLKPLPIQTKAHNYYLLWHARHHKDPEHKWFRELVYPYLTNHLQQMVVEGKAALAAQG